MMVLNKILLEYLGLLNIVDYYFKEEIILGSIIFLYSCHLYLGNSCGFMLQNVKRLQESESKKMELKMMKHMDLNRVLMNKMETLLRYYSNWQLSTMTWI